MVNILFDCPNVDDFRDVLGQYFTPDDRVAVVALSYYDDFVYDAESWQQVYGKGIGRCYFETVEPLGALGIPEENISFINYFSDTREEAIAKIEAASVIYFTGGLPDRMMDRIVDMGIEDALRKKDGVIMGYSAGAVIQLSTYHLSPDDDYSEFGYYRGLGYLDSLSLEVHYEGRPTQDDAIRRVLRERNLPTYATHTRCGGVIVDDGKILTVGKVDVYTPPNAAQ